MAAKWLAEKLRAKQLRERSLLFAELSAPIRRSSDRIDFHYRDRSKSNVLCTARIVAIQKGNSRSAKFTGARCHGIPSEVLDFENASSKLADDVHAAAPGVRHSLGGYRSSLHECDSGFSKDTAPTDFDVLGVILSQFADQNATLHVVSGHLRDGGVLARPAHAFTHDGLRAIVEHKGSSGGA